VIVPTGIATDATTAPFFGALVDGRRLIQLIDFENREGLFPAVDSRMKFSLLTIGREAREANFAFFLTDPGQLAEPERRFTLTAAEIARINPNTKTAPVFRSRRDAELTAKIYDRVPVLIDDSRGSEGNPWGVSFMRMFDMSNDSGLFRTAAQLRAEGFVRQGADWTHPGGLAPAQRPLDLAGGRDCSSLALDGSAGRASDHYVPLYEAKMIHQFDHRWATYDGIESRDATPNEKADPSFEPTPRYWVPAGEVADRLAAKGWTRGWLMGWRDITNATNERTVIVSFFPRYAAGNNLQLLIPDREQKSEKIVCLVACLASLALDFFARFKVGGTHLNFFIAEQLPVLPPCAYTGADLAFIVPRVLELTYTSHSMAPFARDLGHDGPPFAWDEGRRAYLRAELDAWYARAYGLNRDELRYILDPADVMGAGYPSETFRVLKKNEIARLGEYRTARLVLQAFDRMAAQPLAAR